MCVVHLFKMFNSYDEVSFCVFSSFFSKRFYLSSCWLCLLFAKELLPILEKVVADIVCLSFFVAVVVASLQYLLHMKKYYHVVALCVSAEYKKCIGRFLKLCSVFISDLKHLRAQILVGSSIQSILCTFLFWFGHSLMQFLQLVLLLLYFWVVFGVWDAVGFVWFAAVNEAQSDLIDDKQNNKKCIF